MVFLSCTALLLKRVARFFFYIYYIMNNHHLLAITHFNYINFSFHKNILLYSSFTDLYKRISFVNQDFIGLLVQNRLRSLLADFLIICGKPPLHGS